MSINTERLKIIIGVEEIKNYRVLLRQLFAEFLGTFLLLALISLTARLEGAATVTKALSNGLVVGSIVQIIGHVSGGHINPAVTIGVLVTNQIKLLRALCYVVVQILGAITGVLISTRAMNIYANFADHLDDSQVLFIETIMTFTLVLVVLSVVDINRGARGLGSAPLSIGLCLTACQCSCQFYPPLLNPAAALASAAVFKTWHHFSAYTLGPILGGVCAGLIYRYVFTIRMR